MPTSCSAYSCMNNSSMKEFSFHRFPKDPEKREQWILATRRKDFKPGASACICSAHFEPGDFYPIYASGYKKLREEAVPSLFNFPLRYMKKLERKKRKRSSTPKELQEIPLVVESNKLQESPTAEISESSRKRSPTPVEPQDSPTPVESSVQESCKELAERPIKPLPTLLKLPERTRKRSPTPVELKESPMELESLDIAEELSEDNLELSEDDQELFDDIPQMLLEANTKPSTSLLLTTEEGNLYSKLHRVSSRLIHARKNLKNLKAQNLRLKKKLAPMKAIISELKEKNQIINEYKHIFDSIRDISKQFCGKFEKQGVQSSQLKEFSLILSSFLP